MAGHEDYSGYNYAAYQDVSTVEDLLKAGVDKHPTTIAFHAQQAAEKQLKNALVQSGIVPQKTHNLDELLERAWSEGVLKPTSEAIESAQRLSVHAVATRYLTSSDIGRGEALVAILDCNVIAQMLEDAGFQAVPIFTNTHFLRDEANRNLPAQVLSTLEELGISMPDSD